MRSGLQTRKITAQEAAKLFKELKKEIIFQISRFLPVTPVKGPVTGMRLYGNLYYNRRASELRDEELLYERLDLADKVLIEAGGHIGVYTLFFARGKEAKKILVFEPNPANYYFLCKNIKSNRLQNVIPINAGLSNKKGILHFVSDKYNTAKGTFKTDKHLLMKGQRNNLVELDVPVTTIDEAVREHGLEEIDFVKIDTEGFESFVIDGMHYVLNSFRPIVYFEIHGLTQDKKREDLLRVSDILKKYGYTIVKLANGLPDVNQITTENYGGGYVAYYQLTQALSHALKPWN